MPKTVALFLTKKNTTMASFGKKIIAAFLEVAEEKKDAPPDGAARQDARERGTRGDVWSGVRVDGVDGAHEEAPDERYAGHFDRLLADANIPGPDYFEFARMIAVMRGIADEAARYNAAFAGLQVQGLNKQRLLDTAAEYLGVLTADAGQFQATVDASYKEKVRGKESEAEEKAARMQSLSKEIIQLQQQIAALLEEVRTAKEKLAGGSSAYAAESKHRQQEIQRDIDKINQYIH
jgi:hypothetical protein